MKKKEIEEKLYKFKTRPDNYKFTEKWNEIHLPSWNELFNNNYEHTDKIRNILEVGCYEGFTTMYLCDNFLKPGVVYDVIDTFEGTIDEPGMETAKALVKYNNYIEENFNNNISYHPDINFRQYKGYSQTILPKLWELGNKYDLIFIDASHQSDDTFVDAYYCHKMLNINGLMIFDDYDWVFPGHLWKYEVPKHGIDFFLNDMYASSYIQNWSNGYQKFLMKNELENGKKFIIEKYKEEKNGNKN